ncbi:MAG: MaoC family dehydratase N-terminal domain-containing protein [Sneathiella sp.]
MNNINDWVGNQITHSETIYQHQLDGVAALLNETVPAPGIVKPGGHWMYFLPADAQNSLGPDGHATKGGFLPPIELPRRMWAGSRLNFHAPLCVGEKAEKISTVKSIMPKEGRTGKLVFVTVEHEVKNENGLCIVEEHDIVFRDAPTADSGSKQPQLAPTDGDWDTVIEPDPVMLFRYSAVTYNSHRIHYDREYCIAEEGYPGLVVHGPLLGTLLMRLAEEKMGRSLKTFTFRNFNPIFDIAPFTLSGKAESEDKCTVWVAGPDGALAVSATAEFK